MSKIKFPRIVVSNTRLEKLRAEAKRKGVSIMALAESIFKKAK